MIDRSWSLDIKPFYNDPDPFVDGPLTYHFASTLRHIRVAVKSGPREVLVFHAVRPQPAPYPEEDYFFTYRRMVDPHDNPSNLNFNPLQQLLDDAELGRRAREAGLRLK